MGNGNNPSINPICFWSSNRQTLLRLRQGKLNHRHCERTKLQRLHRNYMRYRKTYRARSDTWMMISLTDCLQQWVPSSADAAKRFPYQIKVPARLWSKWSRPLCLNAICAAFSWFYAVTDCSTIPNFQIGCEKGASKRSIEVRTQASRVYASIGCGP